MDNPPRPDHVALKGIPCAPTPRAGVGLTRRGALAWLVGTSAALAAPVPARAGTVVQFQHTFLLGLKDPALRHRAGAEALEARLRARFLAAELTDHRLKVDGGRGEVQVKVFTELGVELVRELVTAPGKVRLTIPRLDARELEDLRELLPADVNVGFGRVGDASDVFLFSLDRQALEKAASTLAFHDQRVFVGPVLATDPRKGWRTWIVRDSAPWISSVGLQGVSILPGTHPNYHYLKAYWALVDPPQGQAGRLVGQAGLTALTSDDAGRSLLLVIDGQLEEVIEVGGPITDGLLHIRMSQGSAQAQLAQARRLAALLASPPHPCPIVVVEQTTATH